MARAGFSWLLIATMNESEISPFGEPVSIVTKSPSPPRPSILVVDDEDDIRILNAEVLTHYGYQVDTAVDGAIAWELLNAKAYDLLITDHNMPRISGVELLQKLHVAQMELPVIMITGFYPGQEFTRRPWLQTAGLLLKPYTVADLLNVVGMVLRAADRAGEREALSFEAAREPLSKRLRL